MTCRTQNPDIPRAGRVGEPGGAARRGRARLGANRSIRPGNKGPSYFPKHRRHVASTSLEKHEQAKSYVNRRRKQTSGLSAGREALFVLGCRPVEQRLFRLCKPFSCKACPGIRPGNKSPPFPPRHRRNVASTSLQKHEQAKSHVNRRRNKISG